MVVERIVSGFREVCNELSYIIGDMEILKGQGGRICW